jgi:hypothetical protein
MNEFVAILNNIKKKDCYKKFASDNKGNILSHFFSQIDSNLKLKTNWEVGFFYNEKSFVFSDSSDNVKEDKVFKKPGSEVSEFVLNNVKIDFEKAKELFFKFKQELYSSESLGDGFIILQNDSKKDTVYNFTLVTKTLKFLNIKINASSGNLYSHQLINLVEK